MSGSGVGRVAMRSGAPTRRDLLAGAAALALPAVAASSKVAGADTAQASSGPPRRTLITGCSSGFGRLTAETLAARGHPVAATMRRVDGANASAAGELREAASEHGWNLSVHEIDVDDPASIARGVAEAGERHGGVDALVSNAGIGVPAPLEVSSGAVEAVMRTNLFGALDVARVVLPGMRERGEGLIVYVSSGLGRLTLPGMAAYCGSKFAAEAMHEALAYELADHGVDVSILQPGGFETQFNANARAYHAAWRDRLSAEEAERADAYDEVTEFARRLVGEYPRGDPAEVADAIVRLVEMGSGARPLRSTVGRSMAGVERINAVTAEVQSGVMRANGLGDRLPPA